ncbi:AraC family transcriptional regulator [Polaromonas sp. YR568]|uniref:AraC family transcriptional regulator n=1 Tax=Polaromonas sp. YR568 TaxID=1855301 RepID=UPI00398C2120
MPRQNVKGELQIQRMVWSRQDVGLTASVLQRNDLLVHTFTTDHPSLILLRRGRKTIKIGGKRIVLSPGDAVAVAPGASCDVQNETERGQFESTWIVCENSILSKLERTLPNYKKLKDVAGLRGLGSEFVQSFERAAQAIATPGRIPGVVAEHRMLELLAWLAHSGLIFDPETPSDLQRKVRLMIGAAPEKTWISKDLAQSLALSEATFRRRLADQGQSFNDILIDVRMTTALTLLQVTDRPISEIAYQVGYESASRFSVRFKKRFGFSPTAVRGVPSQLQSPS